MKRHLIDLIQPSLWDTSGCRRTKSLRGVPNPDAVLVVTGIAGEWAYVGRMDCGRSREGVLIVEWTRRADALAPRRWVDIEHVQVER